METPVGDATFRSISLTSNLRSAGQDVETRNREEVSRHTSFHRIKLCLKNFEDISMSYDEGQRNKSGGIVDRVYGQDTEAFLDDLLDDDFLNWHSEKQNENTGETAKQQTNNQNLQPLATTEDKNIEPVKKRISKEAAKGEKSATDKEKSARSNPGHRTTPASPEKRWTRFPKRLPTTPDLTHENSSQNDDSSVKHSSTNKDSDACSIENDILDASDLLRELEFSHDAWQDERDSNFEVRRKKMENYLEHLRREDQRSRERRMEEPFRRNSVSSMESSTTSLSSSSSSSLEMRYASACTMEELIDFKMKDVEEKFNDNICDAWVDDVELALMLVKKKSRRKDLRNNEAKDLLKKILEQK